MGHKSNNNIIEEIDNTKNIKVVVIKDRKIMTTTASRKPAIKKFLIISTKVALVKNGQNISIKKL